MHASHMALSYRDRPAGAAPSRGPILGIVNGLIGSLAIWALIAGVVALAS